MKIAFFEIMDWEKDFLKEKFPGDELLFFEEILDELNIAQIADVEVLSVFIYSRINQSVIDKLPNLKLLTTRSMGFDHIDLAYANQKNITVCSVPSYGERTVAEHAFALILALSRKIFTAYDRTEKCHFDYKGLTGFDLYGKTIGIIGGGKIGLNVAKIARNGFEMQVLVSDPFPKPELAAQYGFKYVSLDELLKNSDVISLHAPYLPSTHHLINQENIKMLKKGAILINTARGSLVDTMALLSALEDGILAGVGLDVLEEERFISEEKELIHGASNNKFNLATIIENHMLINRDDVIITPHIGFNSIEALQKILLTTIENIQTFKSGSPINLVKPKV
jgi:D-lactate dehydrogenase